MTSEPPYLRHPDAGNTDKDVFGKRKSRLSFRIVSIFKFEFIIRIRIKKN
jgi:hypothetical protein